MPSDHTKTRTYRAWTEMKRRCNAPPGRAAHRDYVQRGIKVCDRWRRDYFAFLADMGDAPEGHSLDRINNDGNYEPGNCRWATPQQQSANSRVPRTIEHGGEVHCIAEWARRLGMPAGLLYHRLYAGWSVERAFTTPNTERRKGRHAHSVNDGAAA